MAQLNVLPFVAPSRVASRPLRARGALLSAAQVVARRLAVLPPSVDVDKLRASVAEYVDEVEGRQWSIPANDPGGDLSLRILALHAAVARIESSVSSTNERAAG